MANQGYKDIRKPWFRFVKKIMRIFVKETEFVYLDKKIDTPTLILSNHVGTAAPLAWELYGNIPFRFWGASEMNSGLVKLYKYQSRVFYHEKKHWNLHLARLFCIIASPLTMKRRIRAFCVISMSAGALFPNKCWCAWWSMAESFLT